MEPFFAGARFAITFVTLAELNVGVLKAQNPEGAWRRVKGILNGREMLLPTAATPAIYADIYHDLANQGSLIPINDMWIAAVCIEAGLPVLARDAHFGRIASLRVIGC